MKHNTSSLQFEQAIKNDSKLLTETAFMSKKIWNYTDEQMSLWTNDLTITASYIEENKVFKIFDDQNYVGFFSLVPKDEFIELDHFWFLPGNTGKEFGKMSFEFIKRLAMNNNYNTLQVYSEPNADGFYSKMGGKIIQSKESKIKDRFLSVYEFKI